MEEFQIWFKPAHDFIPMTVRSLGYDLEQEITDYAVSFEHCGEELHSTLSLDANNWHPPVVLNDSPDYFHYPKVFTFCHDGLLNYRQAQEVGEAIMRYLDRQMAVAENGTTVKAAL